MAGGAESDCALVGASIKAPTRFPYPETFPWFTRKRSRQANYPFGVLQKSYLTLTLFGCCGFRQCERCAGLTRVATTWPALTRACMVTDSVQVIQIGR